MKHFWWLVFLLLHVNATAQNVSVPKQELEQTARYVDYLIKRDSLNNLIIEQLKKELSASGKDSSAVPIPTTSKESNNTTQYKSPTQSDNSLWGYMLVAFGAGFLALLTPCVFPMVPMTVSLFTKSSKTKKQAVLKAVVYGLSIVLIYTTLGVVPALFLGSDYANFLSTHWLTNIIFFVVFVIFGLSFLGMFEITLPSSWINKVDRQADRGGYYGIFFMAFTLVLVSFSCTAPFVGTILIEAEGGIAAKPILGMLAYSSAFALPFTIFAMFPSLLKSLPKSGGWMNVMKVSLGFLELGLAMKFLSTADLVYGWGILDREIFIALWAMLAILLGFYLLGLYQLPHDSDHGKRISVARLSLSFVPFSFAIYLLPGMFGAPLNALSGLLPPNDRHDFDLPKIVRQIFNEKEQSSAVQSEEIKYSDYFHFPDGFSGYYDYKQAVEVAKKQKKPIFIDFTGKGCVNCRLMESYVWKQPSVKKILNNDYVMLALYVDVRYKLPESEWIKKEDGDVLTTIGEVNHYLEKKFGNSAQPYYVLLDPYTEQPLVQPIIGYERDVEAFTKYLQTGVSNFKSKYP